PARLLVARRKRALAQQIQLVLVEASLDPEQQAVIAVPWRIDGLLIDQNGVDHAAHLDELLPIPGCCERSARPRGRKPHQPYRGKPPLPFARNRRVVRRRRLNDHDHHRSLQPLTTRAPSAGPAWRIATDCSRECATPDVPRIDARKESPCAPDDEA